MANETSTQNLIDHLISFIWTTEERQSVTNTMVARVLGWLNRRHKELETLIGDGHDECRKEMEELQRSIANLHTALLGVGNTAWNADRKADVNEKNIATIAGELSAIEAWLKNGGSLPGDYTGGIISGEPGAPAVAFSLVATPSAVSRTWDAATGTVEQSEEKVIVKVVQTIGDSSSEIDTLLGMTRLRLKLVRSINGATADITSAIKDGAWETAVARTTDTLRHELRQTDHDTGWEITVAVLDIPIVAIGTRDVDRGEWYAGMDCFAGDKNPATNFPEVTHVWYMGCKYRCLATGTTDPPLWNSPDWQMEEGDTTFRAAFAETEQLFDPDSFSHTLTVRATLYNQDVTASLDSIEWSRYSEDADGVPRTLSDEAWTAAHDRAGPRLTLTAEDCGFLGYIPRRLLFRAKVTLRVPGHQPFSEELTFGYSQ